MWRKITGGLLLAMLALPLAGLKPASALTISPLSFEYDAQPGEEIVGTIRLTNETTARETYFPVVQDFTAPDDESGTPNILPEGVTSDTSIVKWTSFDASSYTVDPGENVYVTFTIDVPSDAAPGGYFGALFLSTTAAPTTGETSVSIGSKIGPLVLIAVAGDVKEEGSILDFGPEQATVSSLPVNFSMRFQNSGTAHLQPVGEVRISNWLGGGSAIVPMNQEGGNVLPNSVRKFDASWQKNEVESNAAEIVKEWKNFGFGLYTATLLVQYGVDESIASATTSFWVIPWQLIILLVIAIVILWFLIKSYNRAVVTGARKK